MILILEIVNEAQYLGKINLFQFFFKINVILLKDNGLERYGGSMAMSLIFLLGVGSTRSSLWKFR